MGKRIIQFDYLKICAAFAVIVIHASAPVLNRASINSHDWVAALLLDSFSRWAVPIFVMITGALLLSSTKMRSELANRYIYVNKTLPLLIVYISWSFIYEVINVFQTGWPGMLGFLNAILSGKYHLWYLPMLVGLYILLPLLKHVSLSKPIAKYVCIVSLIIPCSKLVVELTPLSSGLQAFLTNISFNPSYIGYFLLGYLLTNKKDYSIAPTTALCVFIISSIAIFASTSFLSAADQKLNPLFFDYFSPLVILQSVSIFIAAMSSKKLTMIPNERFINLTVRLSKNGLGVYVSHLIILERITSSFPIPGASLYIVPASLVTYALSQILISLLGRWPLLRSLVLR